MKAKKKVTKLPDKTPIQKAPRLATEPSERGREYTAAEIGAPWGPGSKNKGSRK